jgi:uncharacterized membrane protein YfcA
MVAADSHLRRRTMVKRNISDYSWQTVLDHVGGDSIVLTGTGIIGAVCGAVTIAMNDLQPVTIVVGLSVIVVSVYLLLRYGIKLNKELIAYRLQHPHAPATRGRKMSDDENEAAYNFIVRVHSGNQ